MVSSKKHVVEPTIKEPLSAKELQLFRYRSDGHQLLVPTSALRSTQAVQARVNRASGGFIFSIGVPLCVSQSMSVFVSTFAIPLYSRIRESQFQLCLPFPFLSALFLSQCRSVSVSQCLRTVSVDCL